MRKGLFAPIAFLFVTAPADVAAQSVVPVPASEPTVAPEPSKLLDRVITNQKKDEAALDLYERIERLETRKNPNDPVPASVKIARVVPSGSVYSSAAAISIGSLISAGASIRNGSRPNVSRNASEDTAAVVAASRAPTT